MLAVLLSPCTSQEQIKVPEDALPVRYVYAVIRRDGDKTNVQYREFDGSCKLVSKSTGNWTTEQFDGAINRFKDAGIRDGQLIAPSESSGNELPLSFLKVHAPEYTFEVHTMYLRFRWPGEMKTDDPIAAKAMDEWKLLLREATPTPQKKSGIEEIVRIADSCAKDWPPSLRSWVCSEAQQITHQQRTDNKVR